MRKFILVLILLIAAFWFVSQRYALKSGSTKEGSYNLVLVNKKSGEIYRIIGQK